MKINSFIRERLFNLKNEEKKKFDASLLPTLDCNRILGIKLSDLRDFAKELSYETDKYKNKPIPAIITVPSAICKTGYGMQTLKAACERAVGMDILK